MGLASIKVIGADASANAGALAQKLQVSTAKSRLFSVTVYNNDASTIYVQFFDAAADPAAATVPKMTLPVLPDTTSSFDFGDGRLFGTGIAIGLSTTAVTYTATGAVGLIDATYRVE